MAIHLTRIYTRGGDKGETSLASGDRVPKNHPRLEAYGTSDELGCLIGRIRTLLNLPDCKPELRERTAEQLATIQNRLFDLGTMLATPTGKEWPNMPGIVTEDVTLLEAWIDAFNSELQPLTSFVLTGGSLLNADTHLARAVCRRLERLLCGLSAQNIDVPAPGACWVNRLSDYLFVLSRWYSLQEGVTEFFWAQRPAEAGKTPHA